MKRIIKRSRGPCLLLLYVCWLLLYGREFGWITRMVLACLIVAVSVGVASRDLRSCVANRGPLGD